MRRHAEFGSRAASSVAEGSWWPLGIVVRSSERWRRQAGATATATSSRSGYRRRMPPARRRCEAPRAIWRPRTDAAVEVAPDMTRRGGVVVALRRELAGRAAQLRVTERTRAHAGARLASRPTPGPSGSLDGGPGRSRFSLVAAARTSPTTRPLDRSRAGVPQGNGVLNDESRVRSDARQVLQADPFALHQENEFEPSSEFYQGDAVYRRLAPTAEGISTFFPDRPDLHDGACIGVR